MNITFENKVVVVTGAAGGLGKAIVEGFAKSGAKVAACDLKETGEKLSDIMTDDLVIKAYDFDITDANSVEEAMQKIASELGPIDVLVNNAGINVGPDQRKTIDEFDDKWWHAIQNVDLNGLYNCS